MSGYHMHGVPRGYKFRSVNGHKVLVPDYPTADIVRDAIESLAAGHLHSMADVGRFLEGRAEYRKSNAKGYIKLDHVNTILTSIIYASYIER